VGVEVANEDVCGTAIGDERDGGVAIVDGEDVIVVVRRSDGRYGGETRVANEDVCGEGSSEKVGDTGTEAKPEWKVSGDSENLTRRVGLIGTL
jgi:hypothetical protein